MRPSALVSSVALAVASVSHADIFQYEDCDGDGSLLLTELDAEPGVDLSGDGIVGFDDLVNVISNWGVCP